MGALSLEPDSVLYDAFRCCSRDDYGDYGPDGLVSGLAEAGGKYDFAARMFVRKLEGVDLNSLVTDFQRTAAYSCFSQIQKDNGIGDLWLVFPVRGFKNWVLHNFAARNKSAPVILQPSTVEGERLRLCRLKDFVPLINDLPYLKTESHITKA